MENVMKNDPNKRVSAMEQSPADAIEVAIPLSFYTMWGRVLTKTA
jgi:hypothetical protein